MMGILTVFKPELGEKSLIMTQDLETSSLCICDYTQSVGSKNQKFFVNLANKSLTFYSVEKENTDEYKFHPKNKHASIYSFYFMRSGYFGYKNQTSNRTQLVCVQGMDGMFFFYDYTKLVFKTYLPDLVIPVYFNYIQELDYLLTGSSNMNVNCYEYKSLANSQVKSDRNTNPADYKKELNTLRINTKWSAHIGKGIKDIVKVGELIYVVSMSYLYTLNVETGEMGGFYRLEYEPIISVPNKDFLIQVYENNTILIYQNCKAVWKIKVDYEIIDMQVVNVLNYRSVLLLLTQNDVKISVLGTAPKASIREDIQVDYKFDKDQFEALWNNLENLTKDTKQVPKAVKNLNFMCTYKEQIDKVNLNECCMELDTIALTKDERGLDTLGLPISIISGIPDKQYSNLSITIQDDHKFKFTNKMIFEQTIQKNVAINREAQMFLDDSIESYTDEVPISIKYSKDSSQTVFLQEVVQVPPYMLMLPVSEGSADCKFEYKINISIGIEVEEIKNLYEYIGDLYHSPYVYEDSQFDLVKPTFYVGKGGYFQLNISKSKQKMRVFANRIESMCYVLKYIHDHLKQPLKLRFDEAIPLHGIFENIDRFIRKRNNYTKLYDSIEKKQKQYVAFQKRILFRFKDKIPKDLNFMDKLFVLTHTQLQELIDEITGIEAELKEVFKNLLVKLRVVFYLILLKHDLEEDKYRIIDNYFRMNNFYHECVEDLDNQMVDLLRNFMAKNEKEKAILPTKGELFINSEKVKKHLTIILDRLSKGFCCKKVV